MLLDLSPLRVSRDYRLIFFGQLISFFGSMMTFIVVPWQMYRLTESSAMVGYIYLAEFVPWAGTRAGGIVVTMLFIGALAAINVRGVVSGARTSKLPPDGGAAAYSVAARRAMKTAPRVPPMARPGRACASPLRANHVAASAPATTMSVRSARSCAS